MIRRPPRSTLFPTRRSSDLMSISFIARAAARPPFPCSRNEPDRKSTRLNSSHLVISYAVFCLKKKHQTRVAAPHGALETPRHDCARPAPRTLAPSTASARRRVLPASVWFSVVFFFFLKAGPPPASLLPPPPPPGRT